MDKEEMIARLTSELVYYRGVVKEQSEIIRQLSGEKLDVVYIHPFDLHALFQSSPDPITFFTNSERDSPEYEITVGEERIRFKQSAQIPAVNKTLG